MTAGENRGKRNRALRENALKEAATKLFASLGYDATTTREIAAEAGCAEGLIHRYFNGKAGLLLAILQARVAEEVLDLSQRLPLSSRIESEILQLVEWELDHMWEDRDFLRVIVPRALLDPSVGKTFNKIGPPRRAKAICDRLRRYQDCKALPDEELEALANSIEIIGFVFGFLRPVALQQDRSATRKAALVVARMLIRSLKSDNPPQERPLRVNPGTAFSLTRFSGI